MKLVEGLLVRGEPDVLDAHLAFQFNAGVDLVLAVDGGSAAGLPEVLEPYRREGLVELVTRELADPKDLARLAVDEHAASWVLVTVPDEFWWPRAPSLKDVLAPVPPRYTVVQGLVRELVMRPGGAGRPTRADLRPVLGQAPATAVTLRGVHRARPPIQPDRNDDADVPLRAWYPIEVFRVPRVGQPARDERALERGLDNGWVVPDSRLHDALQQLELPNAGTGGRHYALPSESRGLGLVAPGVVDDAAYAVECAAVGEVNLVVLDEHIRALEDRITALEDRLWSRVLRRVSRLATRRRV
jgi:hypothetical protein